MIKVLKSNKRHITIRTEKNNPLAQNQGRPRDNEMTPLNF